MSVSILKGQRILQRGVVCRPLPLLVVRHSSVHAASNDFANTSELPLARVFDGSEPKGPKRAIAWELLNAAHRGPELQAQKAKAKGPAAKAKRPTARAGGPIPKSKGPIARAERPTANAGGPRFKAKGPTATAKELKAKADEPNAKAKYHNTQASQEDEALESPSHKFYPGAPKDLFTKPSAAWNESTVNAREKWSKGNGWKCRISLDIPECDSWHGVGTGDKKVGAERDEPEVDADNSLQQAAKDAALRHLLSRLHTHGILRRFLLTADERLDRQTVASEADGVIDVYNYCARALAVPKVKVQGHPTLHEKVRQIVQVTIELPEEDIVVEGRALSHSAAFVAASIRFKRAVESKHANRAEHAIAKKPSGLTVENAKNFIEYCQATQRDFLFSVQVTMADGPKPRLHIAQATLGEAPLGEAVTLDRREQAEALAYLTAAVALSESFPETLEEFQNVRKSSDGRVLLPVTPADLELNEEAPLIMRRAAEEVRSSNVTSPGYRLADSPEMELHHNHRLRHRPPPEQMARRSGLLMDRHSRYLNDPALEELRNKRSDLPMNQNRTQVLNLIQNNTYSIVVGATGSGKTTQVPQILLEDAILKGNGAETNIMCTQPRRMAATSVARRVAVERNEALMDTVGYHVRFEPRLPMFGGSITYCTTGILLLQLQHAPDNVMDTISHIIIDEVHERDIIIDFLMITLKKAMQIRRLANKPVPKVTLMSATLDVDLFAKYFEDHDGPDGPRPCPSLTVPGRAFPVRERYLEDIMRELRAAHGGGELATMLSERKTKQYLASEKINYIMTGSRDFPSAPALTGGNAISWKSVPDVEEGGDLFAAEQDENLVPVGLVAATIAHIVRTTADGAVLAFLPGLEDLVAVRDLLSTQPLEIPFTDPSRFKLTLLHSSIQDGQNEVFQPVQPGCRKIVLSTNIAETSVTIPDIQYVVDTGKLKEKRYSQMTRITKLQCTWISKSNAKQRAGRAGRVQDGHYYALYPKNRYESLRTIGLPEMLRSDLQEICLDVKAQAFTAPIREFLSEAIEAPSPTAVLAAIDNLKGLDALTQNEDLTPLGKLLASLPVHPSLGKMIVLGIIFRCFDPMLILGSAINERKLFTRPLGLEKEADKAYKTFSCNSNSDHIATVTAFRVARRMRQDNGIHAFQAFVHKYFIHLGAFRTIERTMDSISQILVDAGLIPNTSMAGEMPTYAGDPSLNRNSGNLRLVKAIVLAGSQSNIAITTSRRLLRTASERSTMIHASSLNQSMRLSETMSVPQGTLYAYSTLSQNLEHNQISLRDTSLVSPLTAALFAGRLTRQGKNMVSIDDWLRFYTKSDTDPAPARALLDFRAALDQVCFHFSFSCSLLTFRRRYCPTPLPTWRDGTRTGTGSWRTIQSGIASLRRLSSSYLRMLTPSQT